MQCIIISHKEQDDEVWCEDAESALETVEGCLARQEDIEIRRVKIDRRRFEKMPEYEGEC